jgi:hypothetical protein
MNVQRYASICMFVGLSVTATWRIFYTNFAQYVCSILYKFCGLLVSRKENICISLECVTFSGKRKKGGNDNNK